MNMDITSMSTKGQVVIPRDIRKLLGLVSGSKLAIFTDKVRVLLRPLRPVEAKEFNGFIEKSEAALKKARKEGKK